MAAELLLRNVRPYGGSARAMLIRDGRIAGPQDVAHLAALPSLDGGNAILLPGLVEGHTHLDKVLWGEKWHKRVTRPEIAEMIANERRLRATLPPVAARIGKAIEQEVASGTGFIRTHVDIDPEIGLASLEAALAAREAYRDAVGIEIVAFPQSGVVAAPGTASLLDAAVAAGADLIGGVDPAGIDRDPVGQLNVIFDIAARRGVGVDIHLHDPGELGAFEVELFLDRVEAHGLQGRATLSHCFCLAQIGEARCRALAERMARNRVSLATTAPGARAMQPVAELRAAGVTVFAGSDGFRDTWTPYGNGDMLERAMLVGYRSNFRRDVDLEVALETATTAGAEALRLEGYGLEPGSWASFFTVPAETIGEAIVARPPRDLVFYRGRLVARAGCFLADAAT